MDKYSLGNHSLIGHTNVKWSRTSRKQSNELVRMNGTKKPKDDKGVKKVILDSKWLAIVESPIIKSFRSSIFLWIASLYKLNKVLKFQIETMYPLKKNMNKAKQKTYFMDYQAKYKDFILYLYMRAKMLLFFF